MVCYRVKRFQMGIGGFNMRKKEHNHHKMGTPILPDSHQDLILWRGSPCERVNHSALLVS